MDREDREERERTLREEEERANRDRETEERERRREREERDRESRSRSRDRPPRGGLPGIDEAPGVAPIAPAPFSGKFTLDREMGRDLRSWMTAKLKPAEGKQLREKYVPSFRSDSFELVCPQLDSSMARRLKDLKSVEATKVESIEKSLLAEQYKILDIARPLLFVWENLSKDPALKVSPLSEATGTALQLWGNSFFNLTARRRENILKTTDPKFVSLLNEPHRFCKKETGSLFGRSFLRRMVRDADDDRKLRNIGRAGGPHQKPYTRDSSNFRSGREHGRYNGRFQPYRGSNEFNKSVKDSTGDIHHLGGRVKLFSEFWPTLTQDRWVLEAVSLGVRIPFLERPTVPFYLDNMRMSEKVMAICDEEIKALIEKEAIKEVAGPEQRFVSGLFVIPKSSGGYRPIINLKRLNRLVEPKHFKMEALPEQDKEGSGRDGSDSPDLASATLVPSSVESGVRAPSDFANMQRDPVGSVGMSASASIQSDVVTSRLEIIRGRYEAQGLSRGVVELLLGANRDTTAAAYQSAWNGWRTWCLRQSEDPLSPGLNKVDKRLSLNVELDFEDH
ncbi:hypothetical protein DAPPUDRAFT_252904 [Daphnia pulex]|uniref:Uncharacterized protein n=1 Tax=Daphnia pulex TaxID=6669 RepID=E9H3R6_DAPPU|nr:hypothetical protein DAPPUDRAFT_252904 [Daphnia pulex]|eukprot:EFX73658.1 hypothetical protein DAPPUDRAFT_252904 [Daphnia pulex]